MKSKNVEYQKSDEIITKMGIGAVHFVEEYLKLHKINAKSIERWDKVSNEGEPTLAYFKVFVEQDYDQVFPASFPENDLVMIFEMHQ